MKAWEMAQEVFTNAQPVIRSEEEQTWTDNVDAVSYTHLYECLCQYSTGA